MFPSSLLRVVATATTALLLLSSASAEKQTDTQMDQQLTGSYAITQPFFGTIHGAGYVDFNDVAFDWTPSSASKYDLLHLTAVAGSIGRRPTDDDKWSLDFLVNDLGIGAFGTDGKYYACCSDKAKAVGACEEKKKKKKKEYGVDDDNDDISFSYDFLEFLEDQWGELIFNHDDEDNFVFRHFSISSQQQQQQQDDEIPIDGMVVDSDLMMPYYHNGGHVALVFANCEPKKYNSTKTTTTTYASTSTSTTTNSVHIHGTMTWVSFVSWSTTLLYLLLAGSHVALCLWYRDLMMKHQSSRIRIEEWIYGTLALAATADSLKAILYTLFNISSQKLGTLLFLSNVVKSTAHAVSRCLYLLIAMGVGVTSAADLKRKDKWMLALLGLLLLLYLPGRWFVDYIMVYTPHNLPMTLFMTAINTMQAVNLIFMIWIPCAIRRTIRTLKNSSTADASGEQQPDNNNSSLLKLERYQWIWRIYLLAAGLAVVTTFLLVWDVESTDRGHHYDYMVQTEQNDIAFFIILACLAYLWKPNPSQQMYGYQLLDDDGTMNTSSANNDPAVAAGTMDLELTASMQEMS